MLKNFKCIAIILAIMASNIEVLAQSETHRDVVLDGKPAKLNVKTGEVKLVELKTIKGAQTVKDSTKPKTVIQANLITNTGNKSNLVKADSTKVVAAKMLDSLGDTTKKAEISTISEDVVDHASTMEADRVTSETENELSTPEKVEKATRLVYDTSSTTAEDDTNSNYHIVKKGETLYALSKRYNASLGELKLANNLETTLIKIGQKLRVRNLDTSSASGIWVVSGGDTLYNIAKRNNTTVDAIKELNGLTSNLIKIGQKLQISQNSGVSKK